MFPADPVAVGVIEIDCNMETRIALAGVRPVAAGTISYNYKALEGGGGGNTRQWL
jgi:hypothetical protein